MPTNRKMSRRTWLRKVVLLTTAAWLPLMLRSASEAAQKVSKSVVHYRDYPKEMQMCGMCKFFEGGGMMCGGGMMGGGMMGGMGGMMGGGQVPNLKKLYSAQRVQTITYCKDTYTVTTANGRARQFWERNLRLKTDASDDGPEKNAPALVDAGMMGDRADVIFADPSEISPFISPKC